MARIANWVAAILHWDLSSPTAGTPTYKFPNCPIIVRRRNLASIARHIGALSTSTANPPSRDAFASGRLKRLGSAQRPIPPA